MNFLGKFNAVAGGDGRDGHWVLDTDEVALLKQDLMPVLLDQRIRTILVTGHPSSEKRKSIDEAIDAAGLGEVTLPVRGTRHASRLPYGAIQYLLADMPEDVEVTHSSIHAELYRVLNERQQTMLFILEDTNLLDLGTLAIITQLVTSRKVRLLIIKEYSVALPIELSSVYAATCSAEVEVPRFDRDQVGTFIATVTGHRPSSLLAADLYQASKGDRHLLLRLLQTNLELGRISAMEEFLIRGEEDLRVPDNLKSGSQQKLRSLSTGERTLLSDLTAKGPIHVSALNATHLASLDALIASGTALIDPDTPRIHVTEFGLSANVAHGIPKETAVSEDAVTHTFCVSSSTCRESQWIADVTEILHKHGPETALRSLQPYGEELDSLTSAPVDACFKLELVSLTCASLAGAGRSVEANEYMDWLLKHWWDTRSAIGIGNIEVLSEHFFTNALNASFLLGSWKQARSIIPEVREKLSSENYAFVQGLDAVLGVLAGEADETMVNELRANALQTARPGRAQFMQSFAVLGSSLLSSRGCEKENEEVEEIGLPALYSPINWWTRFAFALGSEPRRDVHKRFLSLARQAETHGNEVGQLYAVACAVRSGDFESGEILGKLANSIQSPAAPGFKQVAEALKPKNSPGLVEGLRSVAASGFGYYAHHRGNQLLSNLTGASKRAARRILTGSPGIERSSETDNQVGEELRHLLTQREFRTAVAAASGLTNVDIANKEQVSVRTVEGRLYQAYSKLNVSNRRELSQLFGSK